MATFTDIYKQELKGKGVLNSLGTAALNRAREKLDIRNMLFSGSGAIAATGQKVFGKGYQAIQRDGSTTKAMSENLSTGTQSIALDQLLISSQKQETQLAIIAKNTMNSNAMARDMNVMRQNIMKLVTMGGGKASRGADMFFKEAAAREASYESQFKKDGAKKETTPTPVGEKSKSGGMLALFGGIATAIVGTIRSALGGIPELLTSILGGIPNLLKKIFSLDTILGAIGVAKKTLLSIFKIAGMVAISPIFLKIAGITAVAGLLAYLRSDVDDRKEEYLNLAKKKKEDGLTTDEEARLKSLDTPASRAAATRELNYDPIEGKVSAPKTPGQIGAQNKRNMLRSSVSPAEWKEQQEMKNIMSPYKSRAGIGRDTTPTPELDPKEPITNTPTKVGEVSENLVNFVKKKEGFRPRAYWDHKQWSIGYGTKSTEGEIINEQEADKRLREVLQKSQDDVLAHARKNNYDFNQNQVDALTSFVYNLGPGILNQLTGKGSRSIEEIAAKIPEYNKASGKIEPGLQKRRAEEYAMFSSPGSNTGSNLTQGSSALAAMTRDMNVAQAPNVVVNASSAPVVSGKAPSAPVASATNVDALELFFKYVM
jgi:GH24 family phage-related lysozyme (muramidase)